MDISLRARLLLTLGYTQQFNFPLTADELELRLIGEKSNPPQIKRALQALKRKKIISNFKNYWFLGKDKKLVDQRLAKEKLAIDRWLEVDNLVKAIGWIPWIKGIAVSGSLAMDNIDQRADIDLLIITTTRRLWLSRVGVTLVAWLMGKKRTWSQSVADSWCFNMWLDESQLSLDLAQRDTYTAYEACQLKWVLDKKQVEAKFFEANRWIERFLPGYYQQLTSTPLVSKKKYSPAPILNWLWQRIGDVCDWGLFVLQLIYMYSHMSREKVDWHHAFFHPSRHQELYISKLAPAINESNK